MSDAYSSYEYNEERKRANAAEARVAKLEAKIRELQAERKKLLDVSKVAQKYVYTVIGLFDIQDVSPGPHFWELKDCVDALD